MKRLIGTFIIAAAAGLFALAGTASAHHVTLSGIPGCFDGNSWSVTWTATNSEDNKFMTVTSTNIITDSNTTGAFDHVDEALVSDPVFAPNPVGFSGSATAVTVNIPASVARVNVQVFTSWPVNVFDSDSVTVNRGTACPTSTPTSTPTNTATPTASATSSPTATPSVTPTSTNTSTSTPSGTPTDTPTITQTPEPTNTFPADPPKSPEARLTTIDLPNTGTGGEVEETDYNITQVIVVIILAVVAAAVLVGVIFRD